jgi:hypothetical protein
MELFNKSKRQFVLSAGTLNPEQSIIVSDKEGETLLKMYAGDIIQIGTTKTKK